MNMVVTVHHRLSQRTTELTVADHPPVTAPEPDGLAGARATADLYDRLGAFSVLSWDES